MNNQIRRLEKLPEGWQYDDLATTAPNGWRWANNGKSLFDPRRLFRQALIRDARYPSGETSKVAV